jgi:hypothetical protein
MSAQPGHSPAPRVRRPRAGEVATYFQGYAAEAEGEGDDPLAALERGLAETKALVHSFGEARGGHRYAPGKWSVRELVGHLCDAERIFAYRAFRMARGDATPLASFDEDAYIAASGYDRRTLADLLEEFGTLRHASLQLFRSFDAAAWERSGTAGGNPFVVCAFPWLLVGHENHHRRVLRERYT